MKFIISLEQIQALLGTVHQENISVQAFEGLQRLFKSLSPYEEPVKVEDKKDSEPTI